MMLGREVLSSMGQELEKWLQTLRIGIANQMAYKLNFVLMVIGPALVFFLIKYNLWVSIYSLQGIEELQGYTLEGMLAYQAWVFLIELLSQTHNSRNLADDIRMGRISSYLIYPFDFWKYHTAVFLGFQVVQLGVMMATFFALMFAGFFLSLDPGAIFSGLMITVLASFLWYVIQFLMGVIAFWLEETWVLRVIFRIGAGFLSGAIIPLELYPTWLVQVLQYTPFPYLTFYAVKIFQGDLAGGIGMTAGVLLFWIVVMGLICRLVWRRGLRLYTAAGM